MVLEINFRLNFSEKRRMIPVCSARLQRGDLRVRPDGQRQDAHDAGLRAAAGNHPQRLPDAIRHEERPPGHRIRGQF